MNTGTWRQLIAHAPAAVDTPDPVMIAAAIAVTLLIAAAITAAHLRHRPGRAQRWLVRAGLPAAAVVSVLAVTAAALPSRPDAATPTRFDARHATAAALEALVADYRPTAGVWDSLPGLPGWWQAAADMDDLIAAEQALGTHTEDWVLAQTYAVTPDTYAGKIIRWRGPYFDDSAWWGVTWLDAYTWTGRSAYLVAAEGVADWLERGRTASCGGGVEWGNSSIHHGDQKNAITNELAVALDAGLATVTGRAAYLAHAVASWRWLLGTRLVVPGRLVADHLDTACRSVGVRWSYTQGMAIRAGLALAGATGDAGYRRTAASIADAATRSRALNPGGILREPCAPARCGVNGPEFAGPFVSALAQLGGHDAYLVRQANAAYTRDRMVGDRYGLEWSGPPDMTSPGRQASAVALLAAVTG